MSRFFLLSLLFCLLTPNISWSQPLFVEFETVGLKGKKIGTSTGLPGSGLCPDYSKPCPRDMYGTDKPFFGQVLLGSTIPLFPEMTVPPSNTPFPHSEYAGINMFSDNNDLLTIQYPGNKYITRAGDIISITFSGESNPLRGGTQLLISGTKWQTSQFYAPFGSATIDLKAMTLTVNATEPDGYVLRQYNFTTPIKLLPARHSADTNRNWKIEMSELLRVIQFYNSSGYRIDSKTEDGFAPVVK